MCQVDGLYLKELDKVVEDGEHDDGDDITKTIPHLKDDLTTCEDVYDADLTLLEGEADGEKPLNSHSNHTVDTAWKTTVN